MISFKLATWLLVGGAAAYTYSRRRSPSRQRTVDAPTRPAARRVAPDPTPIPDPMQFEDLQADPGDVVQGFTDAAELQVEPLGAEAYSADDIAAGDDLAALASEFDGDAVDLAEISHDAGELYGLHTPRAMDTALPDDDRAMESGQNWLEALETSAVENGAMPEQPLSLLDEQDEERHVATASSDRPIADLGSAGPRGM